MAGKKKRTRSGRAKRRTKRPVRKKILLASYAAGSLNALGAHEYAHTGHKWQFLPFSLARFDQPGRVERFVHDIGDSVGATVNVGLVDTAMAARRALREHGTAIVLNYGGRFRGGPPQVGVDEVAVGRLAAEHFLNRGFTNFGFVSYVSKKTRGIPTCRWAGFQNALRERGYQPSRFSRHVSYPPVKTDSRGILDAMDKLIPWLASLPKPAAVFACDDARAEWVSEAAELLGLHVPEELAILGVNNDTVLCLRAWPPLSSIPLPRELLGYKSAELLGKLMDGRKPPAKPILLSPLEVVVRQSTDTTAVTDERVAEAIRYIREHACDEDFTVEGVSEAAALSESYLLKLFRMHLKCTPFAEVRRVRLEQAKRLLVGTDWNLEQVAIKSGFGRGSTLSLEFKKHIKLKPSQYRKQFRRT